MVIEFTLPNLPEGFTGNTQQLCDFIVENLQGVISGEGLSGQLGGARPTTDSGVFFNTTEFTVEYYDTVNAVYRTATDVPVGHMIFDARKSTKAIESNFLLCDGRQVNQADYPLLYEALGDTWGTADSGKFYLPDMRNRVPVGTGEGITKQGTYDPGEKTGITGSMTERSVGDYYGNEGLTYARKALGTPAFNSLPYPGRTTKQSPLGRVGGIVFDSAGNMTSIEQPAAVGRWVIRYR